MTEVKMAAVRATKKNAEAFANLLAIVGAPEPVAEAPAEPEVSVADLFRTMVADAEAARNAIKVADASRMVIADAIRTRREELGLSRPPVSRKTGISVAALAAIELGREADTAEYAAIATALNMPELLDATRA